ncbi:MAG: 50S ribosomal protein L18 [Planctomycetaceae bacterium]|nr:MAG: 50S ribosomal protein L18 [Planctomycetaceae bacterium]
MKRERILQTRRQRRVFRVRNRVRSTGRLRLSVFRSNKHIYAQIIDDQRGVTLVAASTMERDQRQQPGSNVGAAERIGRLIAERAREKGITQVAFDRGGYRYHGRVRALAEAARAAGLDF